MADLQITCVDRGSHYTPHEGITHLGGYNWWWTRRQVIEYIRRGTHTFYTFVAGKRANVHVVDGLNGSYVQTYADGVWSDNLLALNGCILAK